VASNMRSPPVPSADDRMSRSGELCSKKPIEEMDK
jgi:hypothetical protein